MPNTALPTTTKTCYDCGRTLPVDRFRLRRQGGAARQGCCRECYNGRMREYRRRRRDKAIGQFASRVRREPSLRGVVALCNAMFARFGGVDGFATAWAAQIDAACAIRPGQKTVMDAFAAILHLLKIVEANGGARDYSLLSDEDLDRELMGLLARLLDSPD